jgi:U3 small nucleolar ribonucleoprotein protein LCP5
MVSYFDSLDPLAFRPNPENLVNNGDDDEDEEDEASDSGAKGDGIYRPPRLAPMPYIPATSSKEKRAARAPVPKSLSSLLQSNPSMPHAESTSGLGNTPSMSLVSSRAKYLQRLNEFEENQFGRVMMGKKESKRRRRDEEEMALGSGLAGITEDGRGGGSTGARWRKGGGWEDEFGDVLHDSRRSAGTHGDGYDELRKRGKKASVLERSRAPRKPDNIDLNDSEKKRKRSRFELERKNIKKRKA